MKKCLFLLAALVVVPVMAQQPGAPNQPLISVNFGQTSGESVANVVQVFLALTVLSLAPTIIIMATSFTRIAIVFNFTRQAMGTQNVPSNQILIGLALVMTFYVMSPTFRQIQTEAYEPMRAGQITFEEALDRAIIPLKRFMLRHTREKDLALFIHLSKIPRPATRLDVPLEVMTPAFIISELKTAFQIGFLIFIPFLIVDLVVASVLLAMGMMMLPPVLVSLPFKILLFIMVDGWHLLVNSLVQSFN